MGMFDSIYCYRKELGSEFYGKQLQTKSLDCCMLEYFLDPEGNLWDIDYSYTHDFIDVPKEEREVPWHLYTPVKNGNHGKVRPAYSVNAMVEAYPATWDGDWGNWPTVYLYFKYGKIIDTIVGGNKGAPKPEAYLEIPSY